MSKNENCERLTSIWKKKNEFPVRKYMKNIVADVNIKNIH